MGSIRAFVGAAIGALIGAAGWAAVAYFANLEIGWIAWGIGVLAGLGAKLGAGGEAGPDVGIGAAVIALLGVALGKYAAVTIAVSSALGGPVSDEYLISYFADNLAEEYETAGQDLDWPQRDTEVPEREEHYPPEIWDEAAAVWNDITDAEREEFRAEVQADQDAFADEVTQQGFLESWAAMDLLFVFLAVTSAFKIAQGTAVGET